MIAHSFGELLSSLGVDQSFSRPRVSNDNAFSESQFKTTKYWPTYPGRFNGINHARQWCGEFFPAYQQRPHQGLALFTPENLYAGQVEPLWQIRQAAMDQHYADHPGRYVNGPPKVARPPERVAINPDDGQVASDLLASTNGFELEPNPGQHRATRGCYIEKTCRCVGKRLTPSESASKSESGYGPSAEGLDGDASMRRHLTVKPKLLAGCVRRFSLHSRGNFDSNCLIPHPELNFASISVIYSSSFS